MLAVVHSPASQLKIVRVKIMENVFTSENIFFELRRFQLFFLLLATDRGNVMSGSSKDDRFY